MNEVLNQNLVCGPVKWVLYKSLSNTLRIRRKIVKGHFPMVQVCPCSVHPIQNTKMNKTRNKNKHNNKITPANFPISQDKIEI